MNDKPKILLALLASAFLATSCGQVNPAERESSSPSSSSSSSSITSTPSTESTGSTESTPTTDPSTDPSSDPMATAGLRIAFYEKFVTFDEQTEWIDGFETTLAENNIDLEVGYISYTPSGNGAAFGGEIQAYNEAHPGAEIDALLGCRNNLGDYIDGAYYKYEVEGEAPMYEIGANNNRYLFLLTGSTNVDGIEILIDYLFEAPTPSSSDTEPISTDTEPISTDTEPISTDTEPTSTDTEPTSTEPAELTTVYVTDNPGWEGMNAYLYDANTESNAPWPGEAMTYVKDNEFGQKVFSFDVDLSSFIFMVVNYGDEQSADIDLSALVDGVNAFWLGEKDGEGHYALGGYYTFDPSAIPSSSESEPVSSDPEPTSTESEPVSTDTEPATSEIVLSNAIYVTNNHGWDNVKAYAWGDEGTNAEWPGADMEYVGLNEYCQEIYTIDLDRSLYTHVIFNNGTDQTEDIALSELEVGQNGFWIGEKVSANYALGGTYAFDPENDVYAPLRLYFYEKFADATVAEEWVNAFKLDLEEKSLRVAVMYQVGTTGNVAALDDDVEAYNTAHADAKIDAILGAKAIDATYIPANYNCNATEYALGAKTDRRLWMLNDSEDSVGLAALENYLYPVA